MKGNNEFIPKQNHGLSLYKRAMTKVGGLFNEELNDSLDIIRVTQKGLQLQALEGLISWSIFSKTDLNWVINKRTLSHRKQNHSSLTPDESGKLIRAAKIAALAVEVFGDEKKASLWLHKPRNSFNKQSPLDMVKTEVGAQLVEETLNQIDSGYFA